MSPAPPTYATAAASDLENRRKRAVARTALESVTLDVVPRGQNRPGDTMISVRFGPFQRHPSRSGSAVLLRNRRSRLPVTSSGHVGFRSVGCHFGCQFLASPSRPNVPPREARVGSTRLGRGPRPARSGADAAKHPAGRGRRPEKRQRRGGQPGQLRWRNARVVIQRRAVRPQPRDCCSVAELAEQRAVHAQRVSRTGLMRTALAVTDREECASDHRPRTRRFRQSFPMLALLVVCLLLALAVFTAPSLVWRCYGASSRCSPSRSSGSRRRPARTAIFPMQRWVLSASAMWSSR